MKQRKKLASGTQADSNKKEISIAKIGLASAVVVAIIGLIGTALNAYFSSQVAQAPILIPIQATQTAEARIIARTAEAQFAPVSVSPTISPSQSPSTATRIPTPASQPTKLESGGTPILQPTACPAAIDFGALARCDMATPGEVRTHTFGATQDEYIYVRVINENLGGQFSPRVIMNDPTGNKVFENYAHDGAEGVVRVPSSGTYTLRIEDGRRAYTGKYVLYLQRLRNPTAAQPITTGQQLRGSFTVEFQQNTYTFEATAGKRVSIEVYEIPKTGPLTLRIIIYSPNGKEEYSGLAHDGVTAIFTASSSGVYVMFVSNPSPNSIGEYTVLRQ